MQTLLYLIVALSLLIFFHEFGHFVVARLFGVRVETFSIGFGPKFLKKRIGNTTYAISLIPLGGYVKMSGENPDEPAKAPYDFYAKPPWQRILIALAGPAMNLLLAVVFFAITFNIGRYIPTYEMEKPIVGFVLSGSQIKPGDEILDVNDQKIRTWKEFREVVALNPNKNLNLVVKRGQKSIPVMIHTGMDKKLGVGTIGIVPAIKPTISNVVSNSPAEKSGLKPKDVILSINGHDVSRWEELVKDVSKSNGKPINMKVLRNGRILTLNVKPSFNKKYNRYMIGITPLIKLSFVRYPLVEAIKKGIQEFRSETKLFFVFLFKLLTGQASIKSLGGPILIAEVAKKAAAAGISNFMYFLGFISLQLGYFNLFPLPILDGGLIFTFLIEMIRRKPLSTTFRERFQEIGIVLILALTVVVFYNDIMRFMH